MQFPGTHAPTPAKLEIESIAYDMPMCFNPSETSQTSQTSKTSASTSSTLSEAEKAKMLQEVEAQQADFGIQK